MSGRGPQTFQKRQKEQKRKEKQQEKMARRLQRKSEPRTQETDEEILASLKSDSGEPIPDEFDTPRE